MVKLSSIEAENALLGLLLKNNSLIREAHGYLMVEDFHNSNNQYVYSAIIKSYEKNAKADPVLVIHYLSDFVEKTKEEWLDYLGSLIHDAGIEANLSQYIDLIKDRSQARNLRKTLDESLSFVEREQKPVQELIEEIESRIFNVTRDRKLTDFKSIVEITNEYTQKISDIENGDGADTLKTGISDLDEILGGINKGDFVIIAARPSMGKTAFALELVKKMSKDKNVGFFSIEMPAEQILIRLLSAEALIDMRKISNPNLLNDRNKIQIQNALDELKSLKLLIDDSPGLKLTELTWKARKLQSDGKLDCLIIDYIGLINTTNPDTYRSLSEISKTLKQLARELNIPIFALSQLSRAVDKRDDKRPLLSDIRESGAIEQDADLIMFLYRENYYNKPIIIPEVENLEVIVAKHRNGPTGSAHLNFNMSLGKITSKNNN